MNMRRVNAAYAIYAIGAALAWAAVIALMLHKAKPDTAPATYRHPCQAIGVVVMNDAPVIFRECENGDIVRDYPWNGEE